MNAGAEDLRHRAPDFATAVTPNGLVRTSFAGFRKLHEKNRLMRKSILPLVLSAMSSFGAFAGNFYVSPSGSDSNPGTFSQPWKTIQFGIDHVGPGDYLFVGDGIYNEKIAFHASGTPMDYISVWASGTGAILDGTGISSASAMIAIESQSYIWVRGLEIRNNIMNDAQGILVDGNCQGIRLQENTIHDIHFSANPNETADETKNAQGIIVWGSSLAPAGNLLIQDNELYNCRLGYSEGIAVNGNVDGFLVSGNLVHDITNIGIVAIGHEGVCSNPSLDQACNGLITANKIMRCNSPYAFCGGIYVDGAKSISVTRNLCAENDYGIEIGCEHHGKTASEITVRNNIVYGNLAAGIALGGYDPDEAGSVIGASFFNNTLYGNDTQSEGMGEIALSVAQNIVFRNNIFYPLAGSRAVTYAFGTSTIDFDYNIYYSSQGPSAIFVENTTEDFTFAQLQQSGREQNGLFANPFFPAGPFSETSNMPENMGLSSQVRNTGDPDYALLSDETDFYGNSRIEGGRVDIGAAEFPANLGVAENAGETVLIFPNPAMEKLFIKAGAEHKGIVIADLSGRVILVAAIGDDQAIDISALSPGAYQLVLIPASGEKFAKSFLKL
jgi:hypothetical protein